MNQPYDPLRQVAPNGEPEWVVVEPGDASYVPMAPPMVEATAFGPAPHGVVGAEAPKAASPSIAKVAGWAVGGTATLLAIIVALVLVFRSSGRGVEETVTAFMDAAIANNAAEARAVSCEVLRNQLSGDSGIPVDATYVILETTEADSSGSASVSLSSTEGSVVLEFVLEKNSDGDFEVCEFSLQEQ